MILELRNMISGEVAEVDFEFPGSVWQLKCQVARTFPEFPLDGASEGVQLWKVTDSGEAGEPLTNDCEELEMPTFALPPSSSTLPAPILSFAYLLIRRTTFIPWKDMKPVGFNGFTDGKEWYYHGKEWYSQKRTHLDDWHFQYSQDVKVLENMWGIKSFDEFVRAASEQMLRDGDNLRACWSADDPLVGMMLWNAANINIPESKRAAVVSRAGRDQVQEILFYERGNRYHMRGERMLAFFRR